MAEAEVTIQYPDWSARLVYRLCIFILPVLLLFCPWSLIVVANKFPVSSVLFVFLLEAAIMAFFVWIAVVTNDNTVFITRDGISTPVWLCPSLRRRTELPWTRLRAVRYSPKREAGELHLKFADAPAFTLYLDRMSPASADNLVLSLDVWGGGTDNFPALLEARAHLKGHLLTENSSPSYTEMWEEELSRRFGATNFIPLEPGQPVWSGRLLVERQLAFGGMSAIYLVRDRDSQFDSGKKREPLFVLKESVVPGNVDDEARAQAAEAFEREARILAAIDHPSIARVVDHFVEGSRDYMLLEYLEGNDLRRLVKEQGALDEELVKEIAMQLVDVLGYLHERDPAIIHKDLTPDNIIFRKDGRIAVIDFGAANLFIGTATGTVVGKQSYIPPEQLRGKATTRSDIYALGATLYFLLTGKDPRPLTSLSPRSEGVKVSQGLDNLISQCTKMDEKDRPQSAKVLEARIAALDTEKKG